MGLVPVGAMSWSEPVVNWFIDAYMHHFDLMRASAVQVLFRIRLQRITPGLLSKFHVKIHVSKQGFSSMASDWLAAVLCANQMSGLKILVNQYVISENHIPKDEL